MPEKIIKLSFQVPVHFGNGRLSDSEFFCDAAALFSALYIEALQMGCATELLDAVKRGDLRISDAFPYIGETLYIPKPMLQYGSFEQASVSKPGQDSRERKAAKKLKYIPLSTLDDYLKGDIDYLSELARFEVGISSVQAKVNLLRDSRDEAEPYFVGSFSFVEGAGLYVVLRGSYDILPIFDQLAFSGLGGKRSSGYGRFTYEVSELEQGIVHEEAGQESRYMLLSSACPKSDELTEGLLEGASYKLTRKGGFVQSSTHSIQPQKKKDTYVFDAGSVFPHRFEGDVFDVNMTPNAHPVYRYAYALWMEV